MIGGSESISGLKKFFVDLQPNLKKLIHTGNTAQMSEIKNKKEHDSQLTTIAHL
jgi:hypothetical protein